MRGIGVGRKGRGVGKSVSRPFAGLSLSEVEASASSASKAAEISSRLLENMFENYDEAPTRIPPLKPLKPK
jgi:hypothetical protein